MMKHCKHPNKQSMGSVLMAISFLQLSLFVMPALQQQLVNSSVSFTAPGVICSGCLAGGVGGTVHIRAMFFEKRGALQNDAAQRASQLQGIAHDCGSSKRAVKECFRAENWDKGWLGELFFDIVHETGGQVVAMTAANFSSLTYHSAEDVLTRCAWEVQLGLVDVCVSASWETDALRLIAPFSSPVDVDVLKLVTKPVDASFRPEQLIDFARPFHWKVWLVTIATGIIGALFMGAAEDTSKRAIWIDTSTRGKALAALRWPARRLVLLGFILFALLLCSAYIAWLSQFISRDFKPILISGIADAVAAGRPLCILRSLVGLIQQPGMKVEAVDTVWKALENVQDNTCAGAIIGKDEYTTYISAQTATYERCPPRQTDICMDSVQLGTCLCSDPNQDPEDCPKDCPDYHRFCSLFQVADNDFSAAIPASLPVRKWFQDILSSWIVRKRLSGDIDKLRRRYVDDLNPPICDMKRKRENALPISIENVSGIFVVSGSLMLIGFVWHQIMECMCSAKEHADIRSASGGNYRLYQSLRTLPLGGGPGSMGQDVATDTGAALRGDTPAAPPSQQASNTVTPARTPTEFQLKAPNVVDIMKMSLEQTMSRNEERLVCQGELIMKQDSKLDVLCAAIRELEGKLILSYDTLGTEMYAVAQKEKAELVALTQLYETEHAAAVERLRELQMQMVFEVSEVQRMLETKRGPEEVMRIDVIKETSEVATNKHLTMQRYAPPLPPLLGAPVDEVASNQGEAVRSDAATSAGGENSTVMELRKALNARSEEIIKLKGRLVECARELVEVKHDQLERSRESFQSSRSPREEIVFSPRVRETGEIVKANDEVMASARPETRNTIDELKTQCQEWRWRAEDLRRQLEDSERQKEMLTREHAELTRHNEGLRSHHGSMEEINQITAEQNLADEKGRQRIMNLILARATNKCISNAMTQWYESVEELRALRREETKKQEIAGAEEKRKQRIIKNMLARRRYMCLSLAMAWWCEGVEKMRALREAKQRNVLRDAWKSNFEEMIKECISTVESLKIEIESNPQVIETTSKTTIESEKEELIGQLAAIKEEEISAEKMLEVNSMLEADKDDLTLTLKNEGEKESAANKTLLHEKDQLSLEVASLGMKIEMLKNESEKESAANKTLVNEKDLLNLQVVFLKQLIEQTVAREIREISELKLLVGQLEGKVRQKDEQIESLKSETAMRAMEADERKQQISLLWELGSKVEAIIELGLGNKLKYMKEILEKVDGVLEASSDTPHTIPHPNGNDNLPPLAINIMNDLKTHPEHTQHSHALRSAAPMRLEASITYAPGILKGSESVSDASLPVPPIPWKPPTRPPQTLEDWKHIVESFSPRSREEANTPPSNMLSPRSMHSATTSLPLHSHAHELRQQLSVGAHVPQAGGEEDTDLYSSYY